MNKLYILVGDDHFFGQSYNTWKSINLEILIGSLNKYDISSEIITFSSIANSEISLENSLIYYTSSEKESYRIYIENILLYLSHKNTLIPSFNHFKCHENKGFQELFKKLNNIDSGLNCSYFGSIKDINISKIKYPSVFKIIDGAGSSGVSLIKNKQDFYKNLNKSIRNNFLYKIQQKLKLMRKQIISSKNDFEEYNSYYKKDLNFVIQEFVPNLKNDYKVLVFYKKIYILKRYIRDNDFRASGSGKFEFIEEINTELLNFIESLYLKFNAPFISLDICQDNNNFYLIEFQFNHFGSYTLQKSNGYFNKSKEWIYIPSKSILEEEIASSLNNFIEKEFN